MRTKFLPILLVVMAVVLCIAGFVFFSNSGAPNTDKDARAMLMASGSVCVIFGSLLAVAGCVLASQKKD